MFYADVSINRLMNIKNWIHNYDNYEDRSKLELEFQINGPLSTSDLTELFSGNYVKYEGAGYLILNSNNESLKKRIPELLTWIQDMNWPASHYIFKFLVKFGDELIYDIKCTFNNSSNDSIWQNNLIRVLLEINSSKTIELQSELINIVLNADEDGASISALELLYKKQIIDRPTIEKYCNFLLNEYSSDKYNLQDIEELTKKIKADNSLFSKYGD